MIADLRPALRSFLLTDTSISAVVGGARVFPDIMRQGERNASIVYTLVSDVTDYNTEGASGLIMVRYQIDCWAEQPNDAASLDRLVKNRLSGYRGAMGSIAVRGVFSETARNRYEDPPKLFGVSRDYMIWYGEL